MRRADFVLSVFGSLVRSKLLRKSPTHLHLIRSLPYRLRNRGIVSLSSSFNRESRRSRSNFADVLSFALVVVAVVWPNVGKSESNRWIRDILITSATGVLLIFWLSEFDETQPSFPSIFPFLSFHLPSYLHLIPFAHTLLSSCPCLQLPSSSSPPYSPTRNSNASLPGSPSSSTCPLICKPSSRIRFPRRRSLR